MKGSNMRSKSEAVPSFQTIVTSNDQIAAVCFIFDKSHYEDECRVVNPDGTYNYSEKCLTRLFKALGGPDTRQVLEHEDHQGQSSTSSLSLYRPQRSLSAAPVAYVNQTTPIPPIKIVIGYYWIQFLILAFLIISLTYCVFQWLLPKFSKVRGKRRVREPINEDEEGNLSIGKIKFHPGHVLGSGSKGTYVYKGTYEDSKQCAVKRIVRENLRLADREIEFLRTLSHNNLVRYYATEKDLQFVYISIELAECTLRSLIQDKDYKLDNFQLSKEMMCYQQAMGLQYLHELNIVHRDLKPDNILISLPRAPSHERCIMITDFGLSRQLTTTTTTTTSSLDTCHSSSVMRNFDGTHGWMPPEIIRAREENRNLAPSKAADIFSLGCVFYFVIFNGGHPFGQAPSERGENIKSNKNQLDKYMLGNNFNDNSPLLNVMGNELVKTMVLQDPAQRPPISSVLKFPLFWSANSQLQFLCDVSDRLDKLTRDPIQDALERGRQRAIGYDWKECLSQTLSDDLTDPSRKRRSYNYRKIQDLLRLIRNKKSHYNECSNELKMDLGEPPEKFINYFNSRFPELVVHVYKSMQQHLRREPKFMEYYDQSSAYTFPKWHNTNVK